MNQICFWDDELEILQYYLWKSGNFVFGMPYVCWQQQNCPKLMEILITILLSACLSLIDQAESEVTATRKGTLFGW